MSVYLVVHQLEIVVSGCLGEGRQSGGCVASFPGPTCPIKKSLVSTVCACAYVILYAKTDEEGHMTFPMHVLDDVTYCTRTKPGLELYFPDSLPTL